MMNTTKATMGLLLGTLISGVEGPAQAGLTPYTRNGASLLYDTDRNLTWVADANLFMTQYSADNTIVSEVINTIGSITDNEGTHTLIQDDFFPSYINIGVGGMTWWGSMAWVDWLNYGGVNDWRLPAVTDLGNDGCNFAYTGTDCGFNVDTGTGELAYMHYDILGNEGFRLPDGTRNFAGCPTADPKCLQNTTTGGASILNLSYSQYPQYWYGTEVATFAGAAWEFYFATGYQYASGTGNPGFAWAVRDGFIGTTPIPPTDFLVVLGLIWLGTRKKGKVGQISLIQMPEIANRIQELPNGRPKSERAPSGSSWFAGSRGARAALA